MPSITMPATTTPTTGSRPTLRALALAIVSALVLTACGSDDGASVTTIGETEGSSSSSSSASSSSSSSASASASASATGTGELACAPVNPELESEAVETIEIAAVDYGYEPEAVEAPAGIVTFALDNQGAENHELAFLPGGGEVPFTDGAPDEAALEEAGAFELEAFSPGQTCNATYELEPGEYTLFCIIETADGETHYELGMQGTLTVS